MLFERLGAAATAPAGEPAQLAARSIERRCGQRPNIPCFLRPFACWSGRSVICQLPIGTAPVAYRHGAHLPVKACLFSIRSVDHVRELLFLARSRRWLDFVLMIRFLRGEMTVPVPFSTSEAYRECFVASQNSLSSLTSI